MVLELAENFGALGGVVHHAHEARTQLDIRDVLGHVPSDAAVDDLHPAGVAPGRDIGPLRKALEVHKHVPDNNNRHGMFLL